MITDDLIAYIQAQLRKNISKDTIVSRLVGAGWHADDVEEAFLKLFPPTPVLIKPLEKPQPIITQPVLNTAPVVKEPSIVEEPLIKKEDPYREGVSGEEPAAMAEKVWAPIKFQPKTLSPNDVNVTKEPTIQSPAISKPVFSTSFSEANPKKMEVPNTQPVGTFYPKEIPKSEVKAPETRLEIRNEELIPALKPKVVPPTIPSQPISSPAPSFIPSQPTKVIEAPVAEPVTEQAPAPTIIPKNLEPIVTNIPTQLSSLKMTTKPAPSDVPESSSIPQGAMLHSYQKALISATEVDEQTFQKKRHTLVKWLILILIISAIGGSVFAVMGNYIKIPSFNLSLVKKDPKTLLIKAPLELNELEAYKIETVATVSLPQLANITSGLVSGEAVNSSEKDSLTMSAKGAVNHSSSNSPVFDYNATFTSSLFKNEVTTNLKYNNLVSLVTTPNLEELLGSNAPKTNTVLVLKGQFDSFISLLPNNLQNYAEKIDIDKLFSIGIPSYINTETSTIFKDFVNNATLTEKPSEDIRGIPTYHYAFNADRQSTKKFINDFVNVFILGLSGDEKDTLGERIGAVTIDSLDVWIGQEDNKIHQYSFSLKTPLSRIIGLEDKGIAGNEVNLDWKTTYYDFNIHNDIPIPKEALSVTDYMKEVSDMKIKDKVSAFKPLANNFKNATGNYGKRSNQTGSCTNPNPNSLFSPVGHPKGASTAVGSIASLMNDILSTTGGALSCYSTTGAWALSAPLATDSQASFCIDSTGASSIISSSISGPVCK
jgi:hypothetical protein